MIDENFEDVTIYLLDLTLENGDQLTRNIVVSTECTEEKIIEYIKKTFTHIKEINYMGETGLGWLLKKR
ncbi:hypothetical protein [Vagococcus salmoninarum]|uniref:hypothetical protein n=1 Tax=Vagococcus salmoninarum TaxID=2739 RepID=UPI0018809BC9|nr:hypothetical protein [Vagococcus salmoninarum]MBE9389946.1 hypothetical protein [Vagococcus salmoninarum]